MKDPKSQPSLYFNSCNIRCCNSVQPSNSSHFACCIFGSFNL